MWDAERTNTLRKLRDDGLSASQIANELGGITRNAVIGKLDRLGLKTEARAPVKSRPPRPRKPRLPVIKRPAIEYESAPEPEPIDDNVIPFGQRRTLMELTTETCHWPVGDPRSVDFFYCGGASVTCLPYCSFHSRVAYQPARARDREAAV